MKKAAFKSSFFHLRKFKLMKSLLPYFWILVSSVCLNAQISFSNLAENYGVVVNCGNSNFGSGVSFYDYNNDGFDDLTLASANNYPIRFFLNIGGFFVEEQFNFDHIGTSKQVNWVDIDNDGDEDLFITSNTSSNKLYLNDSNFNFVDISENAGILQEIMFTYGSSWGDYNNDGYLDLFLSNRSESIPNVLYKNNGDNTFTIVNSEAGIINFGKLSFCAAFFDFNNDGFQDLYVANDKSIYSNDLYKNNGDGTFTEVGLITGADVNIDAMSLTIDDHNNDGWLDIYITNEAEGNVFLKNNGDETFTDIAPSSQTSVFSECWGAVFLDADNDKDLDLYVSSDHDGTNPNFLSSAFFQNNADSTFSLLNNAVPNDYAKSYSNAIGDIDNDGFPEIVVNNDSHNNIFLWKNQTENSNNWLKVKLEGTVSNRNGIGSFIEISINGEKQYRYTLCGEGYLSQNSATEIFGVGTVENIDYVKVKWLSGIEDVIYNISSNQLLNITEGSTLSLDDVENEAVFTYYPNPVKNTLTLNAQNNIENVTMYNMLGQEVLRAKPDALNSDLDMSDLANGTYFVKVTIANTTETIRVIKQ